MKRLTCREATRLVSDGLDRRLGVLERVSLRLHLLVCDGCARVARQLPFLRKALRQLAEHDH